MKTDYLVYKHTSPSGKNYIGITSQKPERRWRKNGIGYKQHKYFYRAIQKYGWDNFKHEILFEGLSKEEAEQKEIELIALYDSTNQNKGYNLSLGGESGSLGYKYTKAQKEYLSQIRKGSQNSMFGKHHTIESKEKNRVAHKKENLSVDTLEKMRIAKKGMKRTQESISKQIKTISKRIICVETGIIYDAIKEAGAINNIDTSCISKVCQGKRKTAGGFHWQFVD